MKDCLSFVGRHRFSFLLVGTMASMILIVFQTRDNLFWLQGLVNVVLLAGTVGTLQHNPRSCLLCVGLLIVTTLLIQVNAQLAWGSPVLLVLQVALNTILYIVLSLTVLRIVLHHPVISLESVNGALAVYVLFALIYGRVYGMIEHLAPGAFRFVTPPSTQLGIPPYPDLVYYSMTALTTAGFGDIVPVSSLARALTMTETLLGQLYLTVLVARLVSIHVTNLTQRQTPQPSKTEE